MLLLKYLVVQSLTWALECERPQRRRSVLLQVLEVDHDEGRGLKRCTRRSKFDEASSNVLVNRQDQMAFLLSGVYLHQVAWLRLLLTSFLPDAHARRRRPPPLPCEVSKHQGNRG